jgi:predicted O-methyltransferase YrrM
MPAVARGYERALAIQGWMKPPELAFLQELAAAVPENGRVVEIGSWKGRSTVAICSALEAVPGARITAVDTFEGDSSTASVVGEIDTSGLYDAFRENTREFPFLDVVRGQSLAAAATFADGSIDWLFVDADHTYESVRADIAGWAPKVRPGGLFSGHDFGAWPGVTQAVLEAFGDVEHVANVWHTRNRPRYA